VVNSVLGTERDPAFWRRRRRFGLTHVAIREPLGPRERERADAAASGGRLAGRDLDRHFTVHAVPHRPWAAFAAGAVAVRGEAAMQTALADLVPVTWDTVVLEGEPPAAFSPGLIRSTARAPERIVIEAEAGGPGLLVVNDTFAAGWDATIDGQPVPILRADGLVRAVRWPGGRHVVEMRYRPGSVRLGFWISGLAVAALLAAAGVRIVRRI
jgi:hypothetical protein